MGASSVGEVKASLTRVFGNRDLRRVQLAFAGSLLGDWAYATAVTVWAYQEGGAVAVGVFQAVRFIAAAFAGPIGAAIADKVPRRTFMIVTDLIRAVLVAVAAVGIAVDVPSLLIYGLALVAGMVGAPFRAAQAGLIPRLVRTPEELTASNAVAANLENVVTFLGPALGAALVGLTNVQVVFWFNVATYLWSFALVAAIKVPPVEPAHGRHASSGEEDADAPVPAPVPAPSGGTAPPVATAPAGRHAAEAEPEPGFVSEMTAGFAVLAKDGDLRTMSLLAASQGMLWGALTVFMVLISVEMLDAGPSGVGYLNAVMGVGTVFGGLVVLSRAAQGRLGQDMLVGVLGWALPLLALAAFPHPVVAIVALAVIGLFDPWVNLGFETIPQRIAEDRVLSRVYAAAESLLIGAMSLGAFAAPLLIDLLGFRWSMALLGALVAAYVVLCTPRMRGLDARLAPPSGLAELRGVALFSPLSAPTQESLARKLERIVVPAGAAVVTEGENSDRFYVIATGEVEVTQAGRVLRHEGPGEFFGEIGLLRDVPRTATVTAVVDTELLALDRADFLEAVTGQTESRVAAEEVVSRRLAV